MANRNFKQHNLIASKKFATWERGQKWRFFLYLLEWANCVCCCHLDVPRKLKKSLPTYFILRRYFLQFFVSWGKREKKAKLLNMWFFQVSAQSDTTTVAPIAGSSTNGSSSGTIFSPIVTATCRTGIMTIKVETLENFLGVVHSRDYRKPECSGYGENSKVTLLRINMHAQKDDKDYCGIFYSQVR